MCVWKIGIIYETDRNNFLGYIVVVEWSASFNTYINNRQQNIEPRVIFKIYLDSLGAARDAPMLAISVFVGSLSLKWFFWKKMNFGIFLPT